MLQNKDWDCTSEHPEPISFQGPWPQGTSRRATH